MAALLTSSLCLKIHLSRFLFCTTRLVNKVVCVCVCVCVCVHTLVYVIPVCLDVLWTVSSILPQI